jgi:2-polyprenyl-6-methoxyphenol hydroxylase-like FAD-dependent oxidoreductase
VGIERRALHAALLEGASTVPRRLGVVVSSLNETPDGIAAQFSDATSRTYDLVVGADGIASSIRTLIMGARPPVYAGQMVWRSIAPIRPRGLAELQILVGEGCFFGLCPVGQGRTYVFANVTGPRRLDPLAGRLERLRARFSAFGDVVRDCLASLTHDEQIICSAVEYAEAQTWRSHSSPEFASDARRGLAEAGGRVLLIGDAAHASSPMMGQGGSLAMEDALVLAEILRDLRGGRCPRDKPDDLGSAIDAFVNRRSQRVRWVHEQSRAAAENFALPPAPRDAFLRARGDAMLRARYQPLLAEP